MWVRQEVSISHTEGGNIHMDALFRLIRQSKCVKGLPRTYYVWKYPEEKMFYQTYNFCTKVMFYKGAITPVQEDINKILIFKQKSSLSIYLGARRIGKIFKLCDVLIHYLCVSQVDKTANKLKIKRYHFKNWLGTE